MSYRTDFAILRSLLAVVAADDLRDVVLFGSSVLMLHGLREEIGDIDVFVRGRLYGELYRVGLREERPREGDPPFLVFDGVEGEMSVPVHFFYDWTARDEWVSPGECFARAKMYRGWPCCPLDLVARHKHAALMRLAAEGVRIEGSPWDKHRRDLALLSASGVCWA